MLGVLGGVYTCGYAAKRRTSLGDRRVILGNFSKFSLELVTTATPTTARTSSGRPDMDGIPMTTRASTRCRSIAITIVATSIPTAIPARKIANARAATATRATGRTRTSAKRRPVRRAGCRLPSPRAGSTSSACSRGSTTRPSSATARRLTHVRIPLPHPSPYKYQRSWILERALFPAGISDGVASSATSSATPLQPARNFGSRSRGAPSGLVVLLCGRNGSAGAILSPSPGPPLTSEHWHRDGL